MESNAVGELTILLHMRDGFFMWSKLNANWTQISFPVWKSSSKNAWSL